jgi:anti-anti-sigma factor
MKLPISAGGGSLISPPEMEGTVSHPAAYVLRDRTGRLVFSRPRVGREIGFQGSEMSLRFDCRSVGDVVVVHCKGRLTFGNGMQLLATQIGSVLAEKRRALLHLGEVEAMDAAGLGLLADMAALASDSGGAIRLCNVPGHVARLISLTHLTQALECHGTEAEGLASFGDPTARRRAS